MANELISRPAFSSKIVNQSSLHHFQQVAVSVVRVIGDQPYPTSGIVFLGFRSYFFNAANSLETLRPRIGQKSQYLTLVLGGVLLTPPLLGLCTLDCCSRVLAHILIGLANPSFLDSQQFFPSRSEVAVFSTLSFAVVP